MLTWHRLLRQSPLRLLPLPTPFNLETSTGTATTTVDTTCGTPRTPPASRHNFLPRCRVTSPKDNGGIGCIAYATSKAAPPLLRGPPTTGRPRVVQRFRLSRPLWPGRHSTLQPGNGVSSRGFLSLFPSRLTPKRIMAPVGEWIQANAPPPPPPAMAPTPPPPLIVAPGPVEVQFNVRVMF